MRGPRQRRTYLENRTVGEIFILAREGLADVPDVEERDDAEGVVAPFIGGRDEGCD